jgi:hypothetical protein
LQGTRAAGFSDMSPALKRELLNLPGDIELSVTLGMGLPTGAATVSGRGYQPYLQFPWSRPIGDGWEITGMVTAFWLPSQPGDRRTLESTVSLEREVGPRADLFMEFVGDYPIGNPSRQFLNFGGSYRLTRTQQIDFHTGFGLDSRSPREFFGLGYSWRWDDL